MSHSAPEQQDPPLSREATAATYALVLVLAVLLAVWGAFLVPLRVGGQPAPLSLLIAVVGNGALGWAGGRLLGKAGAAGAGLTWLAVALTFGTTRAEGDLVVPGSALGLGFLLLGSITSAVAYGAVPRAGHDRTD